MRILTSSKVMSEEDFEKYESSLQTISSLNSTPQVLARVSSMLKDPNADIGDIVGLVKTDASATAEIIRISNSAYYGSQAKVNNLMESIGLVGFNEISRLIGMCLSKTLFIKELSHYGIPAATYWSESMSVAIIAEQLAQMHGDNTDDAYTIGLLHLVGRLAINQILDDAEGDAKWDGLHSLVEWEQETLGFTYAYAGAMLLKKWDFTTDVTHPIFYQLHMPSAEKERSMHSYLYFALHMVDACEPGFEKEDFDINLLQDMLETLSMEEGDLRHLFSICRDQYALTKRTVGI